MDTRQRAEVGQTAVARRRGTSSLRIQLIHVTCTRPCIFWLHTYIYIYIHIQRSVHRINAPPHTRMQRRSSASPPPGNNSKSLVINPSPLPSFPRPLLTRGLSASSTCPCSSFSFVPSAADSSDCCHFRSSFRRVFANGLSRPWLTFFPDDESLSLSRTEDSFFFFQLNFNYASTMTVCMCCI